MSKCNQEGQSTKWYQMGGCTENEFQTILPFLRCVKDTNIH